MVRKEIADLIAFEARLILRSGKAEQAQILLIEIETHLESYRLPLTYQVLFQKALTNGVRNLQAEAEAAASFAQVIRPTPRPSIFSPLVSYGQAVVRTQMRDERLVWLFDENGAALFRGRQEIQIFNVVGGQSVLRVMAYGQ